LSHHLKIRGDGSINFAGLLLGAYGLLLGAYGLLLGAYDQSVALGLTIRDKKKIINFNKINYLAYFISYIF
jgi:hypothetical protein